MLRDSRLQFDTARAAAAKSPLTEPLGGGRPWVRLGGFLILAAALGFGLVLAVALAIAPFPALVRELDSLGPLPETPDRLIGESLQGLIFAAIMAALALGVLLAAAFAWRRRLADFLWPRRRFDPVHFGVGFLAMSCISIILIPLHLGLGSVWDPPILNDGYAAQTRLIYVLAMILGLLAAAAAEEVICRGVLLRLTGLLTRQPLLLCVINGVVFSAIHLDPDPVSFVARALSGAVWTWAALRLGGLEFAIGAHLANNLVIALFWRPFSDALPSRESSWADLGPELLVAVIVVAMTERLARRYVDLPPGLPARPAP